MSDKISPSSVIKEACALVWARKFTFLGLMPIFLAGLFLMVAIAYIFPDPDPIVLLPVGIVQLVASLFVITLIYHLVVTWQRGEAKLMPDKLFPAMGHVFFRYIVFFLTLLAVLSGWMLLICPLSMGLALQADVPFDFTSLKFIVMMLLSLVAVFTLVACDIRLSIMLPGAALRERVGLKEAWRMTSGHSWRMFWSYAACFLVIIVIRVVFRLAGLETGLEGVDVSMVSIFFELCGLLLEGLLFVLTFTIRAIWYERLRLRQNDAPHTPSKAVVDDPVSPAPEAPSGVGPYADVTE